MKTFTVVLDKINDVNIGSKTFINGETAVEAAKSWFKHKDVQETDGDNFNFSLMEVKIDRFNRCFLQNHTRKNFVVK